MLSLPVALARSERIRHGLLLQRGVKQNLNISSLAMASARTPSLCHGRVQGCMWQEERMLATLPTQLKAFVALAATGQTQARVQTAPGYASPIWAALQMGEGRILFLQMRCWAVSVRTASANHHPCALPLSQRVLMVSGLMPAFWCLTHPMQRRKICPSRPLSP